MPEIMPLVELSSKNADKYYELTITTGYNHSQCCFILQRDADLAYHNTEIEKLKAELDRREAEIIGTAETCQLLEEELISAGKQHQAELAKEVEWLGEFRKVICNSECEGKQNPDVLCDDECLFTDWIGEHLASLKAEAGITEGK